MIRLTLWFLIFDIFEMMYIHVYISNAHIFKCQNAKESTLNLISLFLILKISGHPEYLIIKWRELENEKKNRIENRIKIH